MPSQGTDISDDHNQITTGVGTKIDTINGTTVVIACNVKGVPKPTVNWSKDGQSISSHDGVTFASNGTLIIRVSKAEDRGNYTCTASSRSGIDSATSPVTVSSKGYFSHSRCLYIYLEYAKISKTIIKVWCIFNHHTAYYSN